MAITNQERVGKALDLLRTEFAPFVAREQPASMKPRSSERGMAVYVTRCKINGSPQTYERPPKSISRPTLGRRLPALQALTRQQVRAPPAGWPTTPPLALTQMRWLHTTMLLEDG